MSTRPLYYIHNAAAGSEGYNNASKYRLNAPQMLQVLGYYSGERTLEELALEVVGDLDPLPSNDALLWNQVHSEDARHAHSRFYPERVRIQSGLVVNADHPWLSCTPSDLTWGKEGPGLTLYKAPYSKMLYKGPIAAHELQLCYLAAVCEWSRPILDYVVWTPSASSTKRYSPDTVLVSRENVTLRQLWDAYIWPRLQHFQETVLQPLLANRSLDPVRIYDCTSSDYVAVREADLSPEALRLAFSA